MQTNRPLVFICGTSMHDLHNLYGVALIHEFCPQPMIIDVVSSDGSQSLNHRTFVGHCKTHQI